ncbi:hypothetical protein LBMAG52_43130 [Planctomycetia bacterium]|nr:hypothetical protein LBMAG52_43130 [Planctomycetia bacterium]
MKYDDRGLGPPKTNDTQAVTVRAECKQCGEKRLHRCVRQADGDVACTCLKCERVVVGK